MRNFPRGGFTLIEILMVVGIIAILSLVVIFVVNPAELLKQSRDAQRLSDLATLQSAIQIYAADISSSLGTPSTTYISIFDPGSTGVPTQCQGLNMLALATGTAYSCAPSSTQKAVDGTGWLPLNFKSISAGSPIGSLPTDPANQSSSNLFYDFTANGANWQITAIPESQKYRKAFSTQPLMYYPRVFSAGNTNVSALFGSQSILGYWNFDEGSGSTANDLSLNGYRAALSGGATWSTGCVVGGCLSLNGTTGSASTTSGIPVASGVFTLSAWVNSLSLSGIQTIADDGFNPYFQFGGGVSDGSPAANKVDFAGHTPPNNHVFMASNGTVSTQWTMVTALFDGTLMKIYINGVFDNSYNPAGALNSMGTAAFTIGNSVSLGGYFNGQIDDLRFYSRPLSPAEIMALYNAEKP